MGTIALLLILMGFCGPFISPKTSVDLYIPKPEEMCLYEIDQSKPIKKKIIKATGSDYRDDKVQNIISQLNDFLENHKVVKVTYVGTDPNSIHYFYVDIYYQD